MKARVDSRRAIRWDKADVWKGDIDKIVFLLRCIFKGEINSFEGRICLVMTFN